MLRILSSGKNSLVNTTFFMLGVKTKWKKCLSKKSISCDFGRVFCGKILPEAVRVGVVVIGSFTNTLPLLFSAVWEEKGKINMKNKIK